DPDLGQRLIRRRAFLRRLRRSPVFPSPEATCAYGVDGIWLAWDGVHHDGRWGRVRTRRTQPASPPDASWLSCTLAELETRAEGPVRRCLLGPVWRDDAGVVRGLHATVEASG